MQWAVCRKGRNCGLSSHDIMAALCLTLLVYVLLCTHMYWHAHMQSHRCAHTCLNIPHTYMLSYTSHIHFHRSSRTGSHTVPMQNGHSCSQTFEVPPGPALRDSHRVQFHHRLQLLEGCLRFHAHHHLPCGARVGACMTQHTAAPVEPDWIERRTDKQTDRQTDTGSQ